MNKHLSCYLLLFDFPAVKFKYLVRNDEIVLEKPTVIMLFFCIFWLEILKDFVKIKKPLLSCSNWY